MFGTLVVQLPSDYTGGQLLVTHHGKEETFDFSGLQGCITCHYAAFYADCVHEVKMVTTGYRLCLIYNLLYRGSGSIPLPVNNQAHIDKVVKCITQWNDEANNADGPVMMAYLLEHKYCEASLSFKALKNIDRAVGDLLIHAQSEVNFELFLGSVGIDQFWSATSYDCCSRSENYSVNELENEVVTGFNLVTSQGEKSQLDNLELNKELLAPRESVKLVNPEKEECQEATGNEGATVDRWYRWTAVLLWPRKRRVVVEGLDRVIEKLNENAVEQTWDIEVVKDVIAQSRGAIKPSPSCSALLLQYLSKFSKRNLSLLFLENLATSSTSELLRGYDFSRFIDDQSFLSAVFAVASIVGWEIVMPKLRVMVEKSVPYGADSCCKLCDKILSLSLPNDSLFQPRDFCRSLVAGFTEALLLSDKALLPHSARVLLGGLHKFEVTDLMSSLLTHIFTKSVRDDRRSLTSTYYYSQDHHFIKQVVTVASSIGWESLRPGLSAVFERSTASSGDLSVCCDLLDKLVCASGSSTEQISVCQPLIQMLANALCVEKDIPVQSSPYAYLCRPSVIGVFKLLITLKVSISEIISVVDAFVRQPNRYPIETVAYALEELNTWAGSEHDDISCAVISRYITGCEFHVLSSAQYKDWSQYLDITCICEDCKVLDDFLKNGKQVRLHLEISQPRRSHVREQLRQLNCNTVYQTHRSGNRCALVLRKTEKLLEEKRKKRQQAVNCIARLRKLCSKKSSAPTSEEPSKKRHKASASS